MFPTYGFVFIAVLIIASGVIAYLGDVVGRRMGRKRLTLWGLRPRYTAMVMSIVAGVLITVVTLAAAMTVSDKVRDGLTQMDQVRDTIATLTLEQRRLTGERDKSREEVATTRTQLSEVRNELTDVRDELSEAKAGLTRASADLKTTRGELRDTRSDLSTSRQELAASRQDLTATKGELETTRGELETTRGSLEVTRADLKTANEQLEQAKSELDDADAAYARAAARLLATERERDRAVAERDDAKREAAVWQVLAARAIETRTKPAIFAPNEPIISTVVDGQQSATVIRSDLDELVSVVDDRARTAGAAGTDTDPRSVVIVKFERDPETGEIRPAAPERVLDALARDIHQAGESTLVQAYSIWTGLEGEPTAIDFALYRNRLVFRAGEEIARAPFDGEDDEVRLLLQLVGLLQNQVGARARERGVMPIAARWLPGEAIIASPPTVVGEVSPADVNRVISEIKAQHGEVDVVVRAAADTHTVGPLEVSLAVEGGT